MRLLYVAHAPRIGRASASQLFKSDSLPEQSHRTTLDTPLNHPPNPRDCSIAATFMSEPPRKKFKAHHDAYGTAQTGFLSKITDHATVQQTQRAKSNLKLGPDTFIQALRRLPEGLRSRVCPPFTFQVTSLLTPMSHIPLATIETDRF